MCVCVGGGGHVHVEVCACVCVCACMRLCHPPLRSLTFTYKALSRNHQAAPTHHTHTAAPPAPQHPAPPALQHPAPQHPQRPDRYMCTPGLYMCIHGIVPGHNLAREAEVEVADTTMWGGWQPLSRPMWGGWQPLSRLGLFGRLLVLRSGSCGKAGVKGMSGEVSSPFSPLQ